MLRALILVLLVSLPVTALVACDGAHESATSDTANRVTVPALAADSSSTPVRPFRMGWFFQPPQPTPQSVVKTSPVMAGFSDAILIQREVPWKRLLAGDSMETIAEEEYDGVVKFLTGLGIHVSLLVDPLDGLDRTREGNEMRASGRSLKEPEIRAIHEQWVKFLAARYKPEFLGLASEINSLAARGDPELYAAVKLMCDRLAPRIREISPETRVFVSFQVDEAWARVPGLPSRVDHFELTRDFDIDVLGLSSYPSFFFEDPSDIPPDYFSKLMVASGKPVLVAEGGWSSDPAGTGETAESLAAQARFMERFFVLVDSVQPELVILLLFADLDLEAWKAVAPPNSDPERVRPFTSMGLAHADLSPKPALNIWASIFKRPYAPGP